MGGRPISWDQGGGGGNFDKWQPLAQVSSGSSLRVWQPALIWQLVRVVDWYAARREDGREEGGPEVREEAGEGRMDHNVWFCRLPTARICAFPRFLLPSNKLPLGISEIEAMHVSIHWARAYTFHLSGESARHCSGEVHSLASFVRHPCTEII